MPMVVAYIKKVSQIDEDELFLACRQIVPAVYSTPLHPVTPGSINFAPNRVENEYQSTDVIVVGEGFFFHDRAEIIETVKAPMLRRALKEVFPDLTFSAWPTLAHAGWASDVEDAEFDGDLGVEAAIQRAIESIDVYRYRRSKLVDREIALSNAMMEAALSDPV